jgi:hypothetical protein
MSTGQQSWYFKKKIVALRLGSNLPDPKYGGTTLFCTDDNYIPTDTKKCLKVLKFFQPCNNIEFQTYFLIIIVRFNVLYIIFYTSLCVNILHLCSQSAYLYSTVSVKPTWLSYSEMCFIILYLYNQCKSFLYITGKHLKCLFQTIANVT